MTAPVRRAPSATRGRYLLIIVVLLLGGAFSGYVTHLLVAGLDWGRVTSACFAYVADTVPPEAIEERNRALSECRAPVEHRLALYCAAGALLTLALAAVLTRLLPWLMLRRLGPLRPAPDALRARAAEAAASMGVRRPPAVDIGSWSLKEPFTVRADGAIRIVLPPAARRLPAESLDAVLRHETAHVAAGDVTLAWLTRSLLWSLPLVLPIPLVVAAFAGALGDVPFWLEYTLRGTVLWCAGYVLARGVMRDREHEADVHAARAGSGPALITMFSAATLSSRRHGRLPAMHPTPERRATVLRDPSLLLGIPAATAAVAAALALSVWSFGATIATSAVIGTPLEAYPQLIPGLLAGALLAVTWGLALWRRTTAPSASARPPWAAMLGLILGAAAGLLLTLDPRAMIAVDGFPPWRELIFLPPALAGAGGCTLALATTQARKATWTDRSIQADSLAPTVLSARPDSLARPDSVARPASLARPDSLAQRGPVADAGAAAQGGTAVESGPPVHAGPAAQARSAIQGRPIVPLRPVARWRWPVTAVLSAAAFAGALWIGSVLAVPLPFAMLGLPDGLVGVLWQGGFAGAWRDIIAAGVVAFALVAGSGLGRRAGAVAAGGLLAGLAALAVRWLAPLQTVETHQVGERDWWAGAAAGFAVTLLLLCLRGAAGLGDALLAGPVAALTVSAGVLLRFLPDYEDPLSSALIYASRPLSMLALLTLAVGAAAAFVPSRPPAPGRRAWPAAAAGAGLAAALTLAILLSGDRFLSASL